MLNKSRCSIPAPIFIFCTNVDSQFDTLVIHDVGLKAKHGEHHQCGQHRCEEVDERDEHSIKVAVVVALVVTGEGYDATETQAESKEHLCSSFTPHLSLQHDLQLKRDTQKQAFYSLIFTVEASAVSDNTHSIILLIQFTFAFVGFEIPEYY